MTQSANPQEPVEIVRNIWLGDALSANDQQFFANTKIEAVLNLTPTFTGTAVIKDIEHVRISVHDTKAKRDVQLFARYMPFIAEFLHKCAVIENKAVLVHCVKGRQRSCAAMAAYLIKYYNMLPEQAMKYIVELKADAFHWGKRANFAESINSWAHQVASNRNNRKQE